MEKYYLSYSEIHKTLKKLAGRIKASGFKFDVIVAIGTGGFIPARILKTFLNKPILTVGITYYDSNNQPMEAPRKVQWIDEVEKRLTGKKILLVDEVDDSRVTLEYCLRELLSYNPEKIPVSEYLSKQGRFRHLTVELMEEIQNATDKEWKILKMKERITKEFE